MQLSDLLQKTCLIGLSYFDVDGELIKQSQLAGTVTAVDAEEGITIALKTLAEQPGSAGDGKAQKPPDFHLPAALTAWFVAPPGHYRNAQQQLDILNPDYLVTWDIHKTKKDTEEGQHEWWEWVPRTVPPQVGNA